MENPFDSLDDFILFSNFNFFQLTLNLPNYTNVIQLKFTSEKWTENGLFFIGNGLN